MRAKCKTILMPDGCQCSDWVRVVLQFRISTLLFSKGNVLMGVIIENGVTAVLLVFVCVFLRLFRKDPIAVLR